MQTTRKTARSRVLALGAAVALTLAVPPGSNRATVKPGVSSRTGVVGAGSRLGAEAGIRMFRRGGNAVDAGVAAVLAAAVLETSHFGFGGEAPMLIYDARQGRVVTVAGVGSAPRLATIAWFRGHGYARIPGDGVISATVPAVLAAAVKALETHGTLTLEEVAAPAIAYADGFPVYPFLAAQFRLAASAIRRVPSGARVYAPHGRAFREGEIFRQPELAETLRQIVAVERRHRDRGRVGALRAARDFFYTGAPARAIDRYVRQHGGLLRYEDLAAFDAAIEEPATTTYRDRYQVFKVPFWSQGPVLLQTLNLLERFPLRSMRHNTAEYLHTLIEAMKLAFADRDDHYGDPAFARIAARGLLSKTYAAERASLIDPERASLQRRPGDPWPFQGFAPPASGRHVAVSPGIVTAPSDRVGDTTTITAIDRDGNMFAATPSGAWFAGGTHVVSGIGVPLSKRLQSASLDPRSPNALAPGKRPRVTLTPSLALDRGRPYLAFSTPGGDQQDQALLQVFLNVVEFGMSPQAAIEATRISTEHLISSFESRAFYPGRVRVESRLDAGTVRALRARRHRINVEGPWSHPTGPTMIRFDDGTLIGGADVRRSRHVLAAP